MSLKPKVLCVDDEPLVLQSLKLNLRRRFDVTTASHGRTAVGILEADPDFAVILSDMRMPAMDGATFLIEAQRLAPDAVRMLLTGHTDIEAASRAVNEGQIFRFMMKPCPTDRLIAAITAGVEQHRLITGQRVLLEHTLQGSIRALTEVLSAVDPMSFGRAARLKGSVEAAMEQLGWAERWPLSVAAMLSQLACVTLPPGLAEKHYYGTALSPAEQEIVARLPEVTARLIGQIPRLEPVQDILRLVEHPPGPRARDAKDSNARAAELLRVVIEMDRLESLDEAAQSAAESMRARSDRFDPKLVDVVETVRVEIGNRTCTESVSLASLRVGMVLMEELRLVDGTLLVPKGFEITAGLLARMESYPRGAVRVPIMVRSEPEGSMTP